jgi:hypothetical protein
LWLVLKWVRLRLGIWGELDGGTGIDELKDLGFFGKGLR